ncbi:MAG: DNA adenine methylase [Prevotella sp.]
MIKYRGGKAKEIPYIMWNIPRFRGRYIEPFFGGGALFFHLQPREAIINDINEKLIKFYLGVRNRFQQTRRELDEIEKLYTQYRNEYNALKALHPEERVKDKNEELYYHLRSQFNGIEPSCYSDTALYYYINKTAYSGMIRYNSNGEFNVPFGRYPHLNTDAVTLGHSMLLKRAKIFCKDYSKIFEMATEDDFMFLDPPYDCTFSDYGNQEYRDGFNEEEHRRLARAFYELPCKAMMVIGKTPLIEELYGDDIVEEYDKNYAVNIRNRFKASAKHVIVMNYRKDWDNIVVFEPEEGGYHLPEIAQLRFFEPNVN